MIQNPLSASSYSNKKVSAMKKEGTSLLAGYRLNNSLNVKTYTTTEINNFIAGAPSSSEAAVPKKTTPKPSSKDVKTEEKTTPLSPNGFKFNLPPHAWSLPTRPSTVDAGAVANINPVKDLHGLRRGRIYYWANAGDITAFDTETGVTKTAAQTNAGKGNVAGGLPLNLEDREYGFQFLWNPETIQVNVARNMEITPSAADSLRVVTGVFPGQETFSLNIMLDRTNDFACLAHNKKAALPSWATYSGYYTHQYPAAAKQNFSKEIEKLMKQGTMYDLEYLFRAINGSGFGGKEYANLLGRTTANIGYLQPTLLGIELGPTIDSLSYVGWVSNLSMNHTHFTENMIPLRTEVSISVECFSGSGIGASK
jgi:hypothetical protein